MSSPKICPVCRSGYRGLRMIHDATRGHQRKLHPIPKRSWSKSKERGRQAGRVLRYSPGEDLVHVDRYRRSPPFDGWRRTVKVRDYFRDYAYRAGGISYKAAMRRSRRRWG